MRLNLNNYLDRMSISEASGSLASRISMRMSGKIITCLLAGGLGLTLTRADERRFTYTYEPETLPRGAAEFEQWVTLRTQRSSAVGQDNYNLWEIRSALEYGVSDRYSVELYLNTVAESFRDPTKGRDISGFRFDGVSLENRYMVFNPADHAVGLTLYLEPQFSGDEAEIEQKVILGQRDADWKWAFNLTHSAQWLDNRHVSVGELEASFGLARDLGKHWSLGLEVRDHNELPEYRQWENTAVFLGPVVSYRQEKWWAALTVTPQVYGSKFTGVREYTGPLELADHERWNIRLIFGIGF